MHTLPWQSFCRKQELQGTADQLSCGTDAMNQNYSGHQTFLVLCEVVLAFSPCRKTNMTVSSLEIFGTFCKEQKLRSLLHTIPTFLENSVL